HLLHLARRYQEIVKVYCFALLVLCSYGSGNAGSDISALGDILVEAKPLHQYVQRFGGGVKAQLLLREETPSGEAIIWDRRDDDVVRQGRGGVFLCKKVEHGEVIEPGAGPAVEEEDRDGGGILGEERGEVEVESLVIGRSGDVD